MADKQISILDNVAFELLDRPLWLRPTCWRWMIALKCLANPALPINVKIGDDFVQVAAKFCRDRKAGKRIKNFTEKRYPVLNTVFIIFSDLDQSSLRWALEALLMTEATDEEIAKHFPPPFTAEHVLYYRKLFFDIDEYKSYGLMIMTKLLDINRVSLDTASRDYFWKLFAYKWGADAFIKFMDPRQSRRFTPEQHNWIGELQHDYMKEVSLRSVLNLRQAFTQEALEILNVAKDYWQLPSATEQKATQLLNESYLGPALKYVQCGLMDADFKLPTREELKAV